MHQPDYRDRSGIMQMPWVFLHAIKDYYDMPWHISRYDGIKATFNLTPPLIEQLLLYQKKGAKVDKFLSLWLKEPSKLSQSDRDFIIKICKSAQYETMVKPLGRFDRVYSLDSYSDSELIELEIQFILSWCGNYLKQNSEIIKEYIGTTKSFENRDKEPLLSELMSFIKLILPFYSLLREEGKISLSTTPLNHPILPLLIDMNSAVISNPETKIPKNHFSLEDDAIEQIDRAISLYREVFGISPTGFWPAEGAIDSKSIELYRDRGIKWIATDEAILFKSLKDNNRANLYKHYGYNSVSIAFRDHRLSDLIGFIYKDREPKESALDLIGQIKSVSFDSEAVVSIIVDGENAWEFYPQNGIEFFDNLYSLLAKSDDIKTVTMDELSNLESQNLDTIHPGSWIYGTFDTWVGHREKNSAWEMIYDSKRDYLHHRERLDSKTTAKITDRFLLAECSDWFWWYGDDHYTEFSQEFDELFRKNLIEIYDLMDIPAPSKLFRPIISRGDNDSFADYPKFDIYPKIDGIEENFFEWLGCGIIDESRFYSTMDRVRGPIEKIYWGKNSKAIFIRLDGDIKKVDRVDIYCCMDKAIRLDFEQEFEYISYAKDEIIEISFDREFFGDRDSVILRLEIISGGRVVQTLPGMGELKIELKSEHNSWFV